MTGTETRLQPAQKRKARSTLWVVQRAQENSGPAPPLAFVLAGYGDAWVASGFASALGRQQTVYALQPPPGERSLAAREMAAEYVRQLRSVQPHGPYCLSGYSAGAVMALEMAIQLRAQGEEVGLVGLLDPLFMGYSRLEHSLYPAVKKLWRLFTAFLPVKPRGIHVITAMLRDEGLDKHMDALAGHRTARYPGELIFWRSRWSLSYRPMVVTQWRWRTRSRVRLERVPGNHHSFIRPPHLKELARRIRAELDKVSAGRRA